MAATGFTPIQIYSSSTTTNVPSAGNLLNNTVGSELAINITDGKLFYKDNANAVQVIGWKVVPATAGGTGQTSYAVGDILYASTTTALSKLADVATGNALISGGVGVAPSYGKIGLTTHVSGVLPVANGGTNASSASITAFNNITGYTASGATGTTSTNLVFSTSPTLTTPSITGDATMSTGNVVMSNGKGIDFSATSHPAGMTSELLADYEEGTCNLSVAFGGASVGITYSAQSFAYTKVGRQVTLTGGITLTNKGSSTGTATITGLPFSVISGGTGYGSGSFSYTNGFTITGSLAMFSTPNTSTIGFNVLNNGSVSSVSNTNFSNSSDMLFSITYFTT